tara:strand:- start:379 stop:570 length:192 start_codon:yes stop_codon:yes gene_type:complete
MKGYIGDFNNNSGQIIADNEIVFEIEDERLRDSYRQIIQNTNALIEKVEKLEARIEVLELSND